MRRFALLCAAVLAVKVAVASAPPGQFVVGGGLVRDTKTGLVWQQGFQTPDAWYNQLEYCQNFSVDGGTGFRLPSIKELATLVDDFQHGPQAIDSTVFLMPGPNPAPRFWSSTIFSASGANAWTINFQDGTLNQLTGINLNAYGRCVK